MNTALVLLLPVIFGPLNSFSLLSICTINNNSFSSGSLLNLHLVPNRIRNTSRSFFYRTYADYVGGLLSTFSVSLRRATRWALPLFLSSLLGYRL